MRLAPVLAITGLALLSAAPARAAEEGSDAAELLFMALNLALLLGVIVYFGRKPVRAFFADRRHRIQHELAETERLKNEVEAQLAAWQRKLNGLDQELERLRGLTLEQAEGERDRILAEARAAAERIRRDARVVI